jgi:hypothetical protein
MFKVFKNPISEANGFTVDIIQRIKDNKPISWIKHWNEQQFIPEHFYHSQKLKPSVDKHSDDQYIYPIFFDPAITSAKENIYAESFDIPAKILKDINKGLCKLYIDHSSEGYDITYHMKGFDDMTHDIICNTAEIYGIDYKNILLGTANLKPYTNVPYEIFSFNGSMFWSDVDQSQEWWENFRLIKSRYRRPKKLISMNRTVRQHRLQFARELYVKQLLVENIYTFPLFDNYKIENELFVFKPIPESMTKTLPWYYDIRTISDLNPVTLSLPSSRRFYQEGYISFVTETFFWYSDYNFSKKPLEYELDISEKTFKPISMMHPFIIMGQPGILKHLRSMGFKTFAGWWDESYDEMLDPNDRFAALLKLYEELSSYSHKTLADMMYEMSDILQSNFVVYKNLKDNENYANGLINKIKNMFDS